MTLREKFKRWIRNESPNVPDGIGGISYRYIYQECRAEYFITNGCEYKNFTREIDINVSKYIFAVYINEKITKQHISLLNDFVTNDFWIHSERYKSVHIGMRKIFRELYHVSQDTYNNILRSKCEYILLNFFIPVDGDYAIRGQIRDFLYELGTF